MLISEQEKDYELIDSGGGEKLERYGNIILSRPDPQAIWPKANSEKWRKALAVFEGSQKGRWNKKAKLPTSWLIDFGGLSFNIRLSAFKHTGVFPEQKSNWKWVEERIDKKQISVLNLFGYTGGATLAAAKAGAKVTHLDGSKVAISWARENAKISGLEQKPIRWILDDALAFVKREARRGNKYDGIIMDPPSYGHGPKGETWQIEDDLLKLLLLCKDILSEKPSFVLLNGYAAGYSPTGYTNILEEALPFTKGKVEQGEVGIRETARGLILPSGIFARYG
ncbi:MAG: class I SAM-dependent methyltransferase [Parcubacteria group bacterium]